MIISKDVQAQRIRIQRARTALTNVIYANDGMDVISESEWLFVLTELIHEIAGHKLKYARMAYKKWSGE